MKKNPYKKTQGNRVADGVSLNPYVRPVEENVLTGDIG
jgi:hypothetical protein